jgi:hypothetical protein
MDHVHVYVRVRPARVFDEPATSTGPRSGWRSCSIMSRSTKTTEIRIARSIIKEHQKQDEIDSWITYVRSATFARSPPRSLSFFPSLDPNISVRTDPTFTTD